MIHIVAEKTNTASKLCKRHGTDIRSCCNWTSVLCHLHTTTKLCCQIREIILIEGDGLIDMVIACNQRIVSNMAKYIVGVWLNLSNSLIPWRLAVTAHNRKKTACHSAAPTSCRIKWQIKTNLSCHSGECTHMLFALLTSITADMTILIFDLGSDYWATILTQIPFYLLVNLLPIASHIGKISRIIAS